VIGALDGRPELTSARDQQAPASVCAVTLLDRLGRYDEAFEYAPHGQRSSPACHLPRHDPIAHPIGRLAKSIILRPERFIFPATRDRNRTAGPCLLLGCRARARPLVEQILASHPDVFAAGELDSSVNSAQVAAFPSCLR